MKALCIIGSPRKKGCTEKIVSAMAKGMSEKGIETKIIFISDLNIKYCIGCMKCLSTQRCVLSDDVGGLMNELMDSDIILVASPSYWGDITGQLKVFIDRNTPYGKSCDNGSCVPPNKVGIAVALRAGESKDENQHILGTLNNYYRHLNIRPIDSYTVEGVTEREDLKEEHIQAAYELGLRVPLLI
ncbi:flavodoxin family protein [Fusibacter ferrireducens]|uniref:Flavodoxin family protein n=1 Tax=Fusibacter ferrireducens TaxID=2785058 RepID=A0ABR9ZP10_9FIRM|nr:flavodoxin family protein [Fusibacter ferrireducens]MBF4692154.1 flavodoxin family protein [Fusibacter ferrireducens]